MRNGLKTLLFLASFSPALLSLAVARGWSGGFDAGLALYALAGLLGFPASLLILALLRRRGEVIAFAAKKIEASDTLLLAVFLGYSTPFLPIASGITPQLVLVLLAMLALYQWLAPALLPQPLLRLLGYRFYKVESAAGVVYTLITRRELLDPGQIRAVRRISGAMLLEVA